uniref:Arabidopsis retrotransposon Orf1 C-terminal domain-containing protein n=1 Tax=Brassica oleracea var. oleracea TaxID=109376 RepID=A0A0D3ADN8_BRAOL
MADGEYCSLSLVKLNEIYETATEPKGVAVAKKLSPSNVFWDCIANGNFTPRNAYQSQIRNPAFRVIAKIISNLLFAKDLTSKVTNGELQTLYAGIEDEIRASGSAPDADMEDVEDITPEAEPSYDLGELADVTDDQAYRRWMVDSQRKNNSLMRRILHLITGGCIGRSNQRQPPAEQTPRSHRPGKAPMGTGTSTEEADLGFISHQGWCKLSLEEALVLSSDERPTLGPGTPSDLSHLILQKLSSDQVTLDICKKVGEDRIDAAPYSLMPYIQRKENKHIENSLEQVKEQRREIQEVRCLFEGFDAEQPSRTTQKVVPEENKRLTVPDH